MRRTFWCHRCPSPVIRCGCAWCFPHGSLPSLSLLCSAIDITVPLLVVDEVLTCALLNRSPRPVRVVVGDAGVGLVTCDFLVIPNHPSHAFAPGSLGPAQRRLRHLHALGATTTPLSTTQCLRVVGVSTLRWCDRGTCRLRRARLQPLPPKTLFNNTVPRSRWGLPSPLLRPGDLPAPQGATSTSTPAHLHYSSVD